MTDVRATLGDLLVAEPALTRLSLERLPVKTAYRLAKLIHAMRHELEIFHTQRHHLIKEFGALRDATPAERAQGMELQVFSVLPEHLAVFAQRVQELAAISVVLPVAPLSLALLDGLTLPAADLVLLGPLLEESPE